MPPRQVVTQEIVASGCLGRQKGFEFLLHAFAALRDSLRLQDRVAFPGVTNEIAEALARAELFVLSSRYEG